MKKTLLLLSLTLLSYFGWSQSSEVVGVYNNTSCTVYITLILSVPVTLGSSSCTVGGTTGVIAIPPSTSYSFNTSLPPGSISTPAGMVRVYLGANILSGPTTCTPTSQSISSYSCTGYPHSYTYYARRTDCSICNEITADWSFSGSQNDLHFN